MNGFTVCPSLVFGNQVKVGHLINLTGVKVTFDSVFLQVESISGLDGFGSIKVMRLSDGTYRILDLMREYNVLAKTEQLGP